MKQFVLAVTLCAALCSCASGTSTPPLAAGTPSGALGSVRSDKRAHVVYPVRSLYEVVYARGYKAAAYTLNGACSLTRGPNNIVTGCVISGGSASPYYR
ncbi:MAG TPA: hypothetical protein VK760_09190, partial [Candidatus Acidoferrales bacterium]|nr:hypothetical protein [Candidatus Acidoferrales bacterium]